MTQNQSKVSKSRLNAVKHGLLSKQVILTSEDNRSFNKLAKQLLIELQPKNALEFLLFEQIVLNYWRLRRFLKLENEIFLFAGKETSTLVHRDFVQLFTNFVRSNPSFDLLSRYNSSLLKAFYRSIHEYQNLKNTRNANKNEQNEEILDQ